MVEVVMAVRADQFLVCGFLSGGHSHDKGRGAAAAKRLMALHQRFARWFGRREAQEHSLVYLKGLLSDQQWKSVEPIPAGYNVLKVVISSGDLLGAGTALCRAVVSRKTQPPRTRKAK